jgi:uncharacterized protein (TIGR00297 family)
MPKRPKGPRLPSVETIVSSPEEFRFRISRGELLRKLVHIGVGGFALLLPFLSAAQAAAMAIAAFIFNWQVLPRIGGRSLWRDEERHRGFARGVLLYPLSVLALVVVFRDRMWMAAAIWGLLALGDGMASIVGQALRGPALPWNASKGWLGLLAFVLFGTLGAFALALWTNRTLDPARTFVICLAVAAFASLVESMSTTLDDNVTVPLVGALLISMFASLQGSGAVDPLVWTRVNQGLLVNLLFAWLAWRSKSIDGGGALSAILIGTLITASFGLAGFALMAAFFVIGSAVTKLGYARKASVGIAQEKGGARGWRNAFANGGIPALLAVCGLLAGPDGQATYLIAYAAAVATAAADTCSSEFGKAYGRRTFLITTLRPVPRGTEGAISLEGTLGGLFAGFLVAGLGIAAAAFLGMMAESAIGTVAEKWGWLDNHGLNALNTALGAAFAVALVR